MGKYIDYIGNGLKARFYINKNKKVVLMYLGLEETRFPKEKDEVLKGFRNIVEASYLGDNQNKHRGLKLAQTGYGETYKYVSHRFEETQKGTELIILTRNEVLEVETHYQFYKDIKSLTCFNKVKNISKEPVSLTYVSSFYQLGICESNSSKTYLHQASSSWHVEAQWHRNSFRDLGIFNGNEFTTMGRYSISNTGSWSTKEKLPMVIIEDKKLKQFCLAQIENNGSWHFDIGDFINQVYLSASGPEFEDNHWLKILQPNDVFETVKVSLSYGRDFEEVIQEITKERRVNRRPSVDNKELPVIFNDYMHALWDTQTTELIKPLVDVAAKAECEEFCIDAGWFAKGSDWWDIAGVWKEEEENFPNGGFKAVIDYIKSKGMKAGFWVEIEAVGMNCPALKDMPDDWFFQVNGVKVINNKRLQLNFANPEVYKHAMNVMDEIMSLYNIDYLKIDYNVDAGIGNSCDSDSLGDGLLKHGRAFVRWLNEVMDKYPNLTIENCGSGGCRMDYAMLSVCPIQSTSDQTNYRKYPYLAANVLTACTPEQAAVWSYPLNDYEKVMPTDEVVVMNMVNAMLGRIHLASFINKLPESQLDLIREGVRYYKSIREFKKNSLPIFPKGTALFFDKEVVGGLVNGKKMILAVWNTSGKPNSVKVNLSKYGVKNLKVGYPTSLKTDYEFESYCSILKVHFNEPYGGRVFEIDLN